MECQWNNDNLVLVIGRDELPVDKDIIDAVWDSAMADEVMGATVGKFIVVCISVLFKGVLQYL